MKKEKLIDGKILRTCDCGAPMRLVKGVVAISNRCTKTSLFQCVQCKDVLYDFEDES